MKTEKEVKQKIKDTREKLSTGDLSLELCQWISCPAMGST